MSKIDEVLEILKSNVVKKDDKKTCPLVGILAVIGAIAAVAGICYGIYRYFSTQSEEEIDDDGRGGCRCIRRAGRDGNGRRLHVDVPDQRRHGILKEEN